MYPRLHPAAKSTCRYHKEGKCTFGKNCRFAHPGAVDSQIQDLSRFPMSKLHFFMTRILIVSSLEENREDHSSRNSEQSTSRRENPGWRAKSPLTKNEERFDLASLDLLEPTNKIDLDYLHQTPRFSHISLIIGIRQRLPTSEIAGYLSKWDEGDVRDKINLKYRDYPPLFHAAQTNDCKLIRLLIERGARHDVCGRFAIPLLPWIILQDHPRSSQLVGTLLSLGCSANTIPSDMYEDVMRTPQDVVADEVLPKLPWCTPSLRVELARRMNLSHRYLLNKASKQESPSPKRLQIASYPKISGLFGIPYFIVGQEIATEIVCSSVISHLVFKRSHPLVMAFAGPPGHGKTELALQMGELLSTDIIVIDCTEMKHETDLFDPKAPYSGHQAGSPLNNHLTNDHRKRTVVFLDEFDKTTEEVRQSLLLVIEKGMSCESNVFFCFL